MQALTPYKEAVEVVKEAGGEPLELCYQCGLCTATCPWNLVRSFLVRRMINSAQLGLLDFEDEDIWRCVTCGACVERCPRGVEIIDIMRALRRTVVALGVGKVPDSLRITMKNVPSLGNPFGEPRENRTNWGRQLNLKQPAPGTEALYFPCCMVEYDPVAVGIGKAMASIFQKTDTDFGVLGAEASCCGESMRKAGDEDLFQSLVQANTKLFVDSGAKQIVVSSPHCYYTFNNEYEGLKNGLPVLHSTQFLAGLIDSGKLKPSKSLNKKVTYHDPCYLGRHSGVYDEPRQVLSSIPGLELVEMPDHHENSLCCGSGGGGMFMEAAAGERIVEPRIQQAIEVGADVLAVACPYCYLTFVSAAQTMTTGNVPEIKDVSELVAEAM